MQRFSSALALAAVGVLALGGALFAQGAVKKPEPKRPQLTLKATPNSGMVPVRIAGLAELKGGDDDFEDYYCPTIEWNWGDGTISESSNDCDPYEPGKSQIKRRYTVDHQYKNPGNFRVYLRLKKGPKIVAVANTAIQVRPGLMQP